jgi:hypothetical protein
MLLFEYSGGILLLLLAWLVLIVIVVNDGVADAIGNIVVY